MEIHKLHTFHSVLCYLSIVQIATKKQVVHLSATIPPRAHPMMSPMTNMLAEDKVFCS